MVAEAFTAGLCREHVSADGTLIGGFASAKSFQPKDTKDAKGVDSNDADGFRSRNGEVDFHGQKRTNETHASRTDPEA